MIDEAHAAARKYYASLAQVEYNVESKTAKMSLCASSPTTSNLH